MSKKERIILLYILIILSLLFTGYILKSNLTISIFFMGLLSYIFSNVSPQVPDYGNYFQYYYGGEYYRNLLQKGYESVSILFLNHGYSFVNFRLALAILTFIMLWLAIQIWTKNILWVLAFYLISYFPMDIIQIRNFVMLGFSTLAITILTKNGNLKYVISLFSIWVGAQFHTMGLIYLPIVIVTMLPNFVAKKMRKYSIPIAIVGTIGFFLGSRAAILGPLAGFVGRLSGSESQITNKLTDRYTTGTSLSMLLVVIVVNVIIWIAVKKISQYEKNNSNKEVRVVIDTIKNIASYGLILSPLMIIAPDYSRVFRNFGLLFIIFFIMILSKRDVEHGSKTVATLSLLIMSLAGLAVWARYFVVLF